MSKLIYYLIRIITFPFALMPFWMIHKIGKALGFLLYYALPKYRKRTLSNLALAKDLGLSSDEIKKIAKKSFQNLAIVVLEYPKLAHSKNLFKGIICTNPEKIESIYNEGKGVIFFVAHQSNWEVLFLYGTSRMKGLGIGKPINNKYLYQWILDMRQRFGGIIVEAKKALKESVRALKKGHFVGIVGDQGMPTSDYCYPFLGTKAKNTTAPALLSYKTGAPIVFAETKREDGKYLITLSDPLYPNKENPIDKEVPALMNKMLFLLEESIKKNPSEWLWQHNRYKQQTPHLIFKAFRHETILIILPLEKAIFNKVSPHIPLLLKIYEGSFITLLIPEAFEKNCSFSCKIKTYKTYHETLLDDYSFKMVFNFTPYSKINAYYKKRSCLKTLTLKSLQKMGKTMPLDKILKKTLCRKDRI